MSRFRLTTAVIIVVSGVMSGCGSLIQFPASSPNLTLIGDLYRPDKSGQLPAVVLLAPCGGVTQVMNGWASWLKGEGYVALVVDSFTPRGTRNACQGQSPRIWEAAQDAIAALNYVKTLTFVDGDRVAVMGWSHGGGAALEASSLLSRARSDPRARLAFRAAVAFYPNCRYLDDQTQTPTLMLLAGRDDWTPPDQCVAVAKRIGLGLVSWKIYPDAYHAFDLPGRMRTYLGYVLAYDGSATGASRKEVQAFLAEQLQGKR